MPPWTSPPFVDALLVLEPDLALARERGVARELCFDVGTDLARAHRHRLDRLGHKALLQLRRSERFADFRAELARDLRVQLGWADDAVPLHAVEAAKSGLREGRHVGQQRMACHA